METLRDKIRVKIRVKIRGKTKVKIRVTHLQARWQMPKSRKPLTRMGTYLGDKCSDEGVCRVLRSCKASEKDS